MGWASALVGHGLRAALGRLGPERRADLAEFLLRRLPAERLADALRNAARSHARAVPPADALRFLFRLDQSLYRLEGETALAFGGGLHPKHRLTRYHDFFVSRLAAGERVLDVGCGNGALAEDLARRAGALVTGVELAAASVDDARRLHAHPNVTYVHADATRELPPGPYDVVVLSNVLEHLRDRPVFLAKLREASGARRFLLRVPRWDRDWRVPLMDELGVDSRLDPTHETEYTPERFREELAAAGLSPVHEESRWGELWAEARARSGEGG